VRLEELGKLKDPMTTSGIEPATFRLVAQYLNQLRYRLPPSYKLSWRRIPLTFSLTLFNFPTEDLP
jgi:hypothetical protein